MDPHAMLAVALEQARIGFAEGGVPVGGAIFHIDGTLLGAGRNRLVQEGNCSLHGETDAFRAAGRRPTWHDTILVTTLAPCWYCSGLIRQFGIRTLVVGESRNFSGGVDWLRSLGVKVVDLDSQECSDLLTGFIEEHPEIWNEDIGKD